MNFPNVLLFAALVAICLDNIVSAEVCLSRKLYKARLDRVVSEARKAGKDITSIRCMKKTGMAFKPKEVQLRPPKLFKCYEKGDVKTFLMKTIKKCIRK